MKLKIFGILGILFFALAYPPFGVSYLIFAAFALLFYGAKNKNMINCIVISIIMINSCYFFVFNIKDINFTIKIIYYLLLCVWSIIYLYILMYIIINLPKDKIYSGLLAGGVWVGLEIISQKLLNISFFLFVTQYDSYVFISIGRYYGIYMISFMIIWINYIIYQFIITKNYKVFIINFIMFLILFNIPQLIDSIELNCSNKVSVVVVQPNKSIEAYGGSNNIGLYAQDFEFYSLFDKKLFENQEIDFIIWPEGVFNKWIFRIPEYRDHIISLAHETEAYLIIGSPDLNENLNQYNGAFIVSPGGQIDYYYKNRLVPFSETFFVPGKGKKNVQTEYGVVDFSICWEALSLQSPSKANISFLLINDASMGRSYVSLFHSLLGIFNALEKRCALVVASNTGPSMLISYDGRIAGMAPLFRPYILSGCIDVNLNKGLYLHVNHFVYLMILLIGLITALKEKNIIYISKVSILDFFITILVSFTIIKANIYKVDMINRGYLPQPEIKNKYFQAEKITQLKLEDNKKRVIKTILSNYGIYLEKYYKQDILQKSSINELVKGFQFELVSVKIDEVKNLLIPIIGIKDNQWYIIYTLNNKIARVINYVEDFNQTLDLTQIRSFFDSFYVICPLPLNLEVDHIIN